MFGRALVWLPLACAPALAACSLLLGDGFSGSSDPSDSGANSTDSPVDAGDPSTERDGAQASDGSQPTFDGGELCADAAGILCDDFERGDILGRWGAAGVNDAGKLEIVTAAGGGRRLLSAISASEGVAQLTRDFGSVTPTRIHIELTVDIETVPTDGAVYVAGVLMLNPGNSPSLVYLYAHGSGFFFVEQLTDGAHYVQSALTLAVGAPHRVVMDVKVGGKSVVTVDGATQVDKAIEPWLVMNPPTAILGAGSVGGGNSLSMTVDDYVFIAE